MKKFFAKLNKKVEKFLSSSASEDTKKRVIANIEKANSQEYQMQVAEHGLINKVIDDMWSDPYWREIMIECYNAQKES